jgi:DNA-binding XRE family transcriptional regulator
VAAEPAAVAAARLGRSLSAVYARRHATGADGFLVPVDRVALRRLRTAAGLTQHELADRAGVQRRKPRNLESGRDRRARRDDLIWLAAVLGAR